MTPNTTGLLVGLVIAAVVALVVTGAVVAELGTAACEHTLGEGYDYADDQPVFDGQLDCVAPNETVIHDVDARPMNVTSDL